MSEPYLTLGSDIRTAISTDAVWRNDPFNYKIREGATFEELRVALENRTDTSVVLGTKDSIIREHAITLLRGILGMNEEQMFLISLYGGEIGRMEYRYRHKGEASA